MKKFILWFFSIIVLIIIGFVNISPVPILVSIILFFYPLFKIEYNSIGTKKERKDYYKKKEIEKKIEKEFGTLQYYHKNK